MSTSSLGTRRAYAERYEHPEPTGGANQRDGRSRGLAGWYNDVPTQLKGLIVVAVIFATMFVQSAFAYRASLESEQTARNVTHSERVISNGYEAIGAVTGMETGLRGFYLTGREEFLTTYNIGRTDFANAIREVEALTATNPEQLRRWQDLETRATTWQREVAEPGIALRREVSTGRKSLDDMGAYVATGEGKRQTDAMRNLVAEVLATEITLLEQRQQANVDTQIRLRQVIIFGSLATLVFGIALAMAVGRATGNVTKDLARAATAIAEGRQDVRVTFRSKDEQGQLADAFRAMIANQRRMAHAADAIVNGELGEVVVPQSQHDVLGNAFARMTENLRAIVGELQLGTNNLSSAGAEILAAAAQQAAGATEQSAAIAETTATVDEVRASAEQTESMALIVSENAARAIRVADEGVAAVSDANAGMTEIRERVQSIAENILTLAEQSQQIGEIITTVSDLADQSNLLALNAAIEASRAGEHGKGFTVVAQEIRTLAEGSKAATAQVRTILSDIQRATNAAVMATEQGTKGVDAGMATIDQAGHTIDELAEAIRQAAGSATQITASVRQHAVGMEQIAAAMGDINGATSQSLAAVHNTQEAAENLTDLAGRLTRLIGQYRM